MRLALITKTQKPMKTTTALIIAATMTAHAQTQQPDPQKVKVETMSLTVSALPYQFTDQGLNPVERREAFPNQAEFASGTELLLKVDFPEGVYPCHPRGDDPAPGTGKILSIKDSTGADLLGPHIGPDDPQRIFAFPAAYATYADPSATLLLLKTPKLPAAGATSISGEASIKAVHGKLVVEDWKPSRGSNVWKKSADVWFPYELGTNKITVQGGGVAWISLRAYTSKGKLCWEISNTNKACSEGLGGKMAVARFEILYALGEIKDTVVPFVVGIGGLQAKPMPRDTLYANP